jgi:hypothetical protein
VHAAYNLHGEAAPKVVREEVLARTLGRRDGGSGRRGRGRRRVAGTDSELAGAGHERLGEDTVHVAARLEGRLGDDAWSVSLEGREGREGMQVKVM